VAGKGAQNLDDRFALLGRELAQPVVHIDHGLRLDEHGTAGGRTVVEYARHGTPRFALDREAVAPIAHGHEGVLQMREHVGIGEHTPQAVLEQGLGLADVAPGFEQIQRGVVLDFARVVNRVVNGFFQIRAGGDARGE